MSWGSSGTYATWCTCQDSDPRTPRLLTRIPRRCEIVTDPQRIRRRKDVLWCIDQELCGYLMLSGRNEWHLHFLQLWYPWSAWIAREAGSQLVPSACPFRVWSVNPFSPFPNYLETHLKRAYRAFTCHSRCVSMPLSSMIQYLQDFVNLA